MWACMYHMVRKSPEEKENCKNSSKRQGLKGFCIFFYPVFYNPGNQFPR